jgi:hypothetical protein
MRKKREQRLIDLKEAFDRGFAAGAWRPVKVGLEVMAAVNGRGAYAELYATLRGRAFQRVATAIKRERELRQAWEAGEPWAVAEINGTPRGEMTARAVETNNALAALDVVKLEGG